ncbi:predicted protein, partial [Nematostella vectensis]
MSLQKSTHSQYIPCTIQIEKHTEGALAALSTVSVKNIHMRYEDQVTSCESPFAVGFTLQNLSAETTDDNWKTSVVNAAAKTVFKQCIGIQTNMPMTCMATTGIGRWKYAYTAICEEGIRSWSWERIKAHRARYRAYKSLYKRKLKGFHDSERESSLRHLQALEDDLGIPSVLIAKQQAELE